MRTRQLRALRGASAAAIAVLLAAVSHTIGGGVAPSPVILIGVAALTWPITTALVGRRLRPAGLAAAVVLAQAALHVVFAFTSSAGILAPSQNRAFPEYGALPAYGALHEHGQILLGSPGGVAQIVIPSAAMLLAHAVAAVASFALLFSGERMLRIIAAWTLRLLDRTAVSTSPIFAVPRAAFAVAPAPSFRIVRGVVHRRGPPLPWGDASVA